MLIEVVATYRLADDSPDRGYILFTPVVMRGDATPTKKIITQSPVKAVLDSAGRISVMLNDSYDLGWVSYNQGQPVPYKVEMHLSGGVTCYHTLIKGPSPFDLADSIPPDESGVIVVQENEVEVGVSEPTGKFEIFADTSTIYPITGP